MGFFKIYETADFKDYFFLAFKSVLKSFPALKRAPLEAGILISFPVCGLRPIRAFLSPCSNVPKPIKITLVFEATCSLMVANIVSTTSETVLLEMSDNESVTIEMMSALLLTAFFIFFTPAMVSPSNIVRSIKEIWARHPP